MSTQWCLILVTPDLKWNLYVLGVSVKASKNAGFYKRRSCFVIIHDQCVCTALYTSLVRSDFGYCAQVWVPQKDRHKSRTITKAGPSQRGCKGVITPGPTRGP